MDFTREDYENLPARHVAAFKEFVLRRFCDYTRFTKVLAASYPGGIENKPVGWIDSPKDSHGWGGWKVARDLFDDEADYFLVCHYLEDERAPISYTNYVKVPKAFVFGEMEEDA